MGLFDSFIKKVKGYQNYTKKDFLSEPKETLLDAANVWMGSQITNWDEEMECVASWEEPLRILYACGTVFDDIMNGGFIQMFFNSSSRWMNLAIRGFQTLGLNTISDALNAALDVYDEHSERIEAYRDGTIESITKLYELHLFDSYDDILAKEQELERRVLTAYIKANIRFFGK